MSIVNRNSDGNLYCAEFIAKKQNNFSKLILGFFSGFAKPCPNLPFPLPCPHTGTLQYFCTVVLFYKLYNTIHFCTVS